MVDVSVATVCSSGDDVEGGNANDTSYTAIKLPNPGLGLESSIQPS
jgi:hypothetical protein